MRFVFFRQKLQDAIGENYSIEEGRIIFKHTMQGASVDEAIEIYHRHVKTRKKKWHNIIQVVK
ncbi:MAG: hypothetical protein CSA50_00995 [Gammaproteobacteria bacterium]|nr:MAG: hypothetical protein CSA50_00995 [Gammaproteobacteria bacterium]